MARVVVFHNLKYSKVRPIFNRKSNIHKNTVVVGVKIANAAKVRLGRAPKRIDTGRLRASIGTRVFIDRIQDVPGVDVGTNVEYAWFVHEGTRYMQANPFLRDAVISLLK